MRLAIIGGGQIGTSVARAAAASGQYRDIVIAEANADAREDLKAVLASEPSAKRISVTDDNSKAAQRADIVVLATPIDQFGPTTKEIAPALKSGAAITDVGSTKQQLGEAIQAALPPGLSKRYVPAHPTVGAEGSGPKTSKIDMFKGGTIIVDSSTADASASAAVIKLWQDVGGTPLGLTAGDHDKLYGTTSHLQHLVAFAATKSLPADGGKLSEDQRSLFQITRIADANPDMWLPIFAGNKGAITSSGEAYSQQLGAIKKSLQDNDPAALLSMLKQARDFTTDFQEANDDPVLSAATDTISASQPDPKAAAGLGLPMVLASVTALNAQRVEQEKARADQEAQRAEQEKARAEKEKARADRLAAQLKALGINPAEDND